MTKKERNTSRRTALLGIGALASLPFILSSDDGSTEFSGEKLNFFNREIFIDRFAETPEGVYQNCVALCPEILMPQSFEAERLKQIWGDGIAGEIEEKGMSPQTDVSLRMQFFGLPDGAEFMVPLKGYCEKASRYLYSQLSGLEKQAMEWIIIKRGDNFVKNCGNKGFVGNSYGYRVVAFAENPREPGKPILREAFYPFHGSTAYSHKKETLLEVNPFKFIFIGVGGRAFAAPFSELIGLSTMERMNQNDGLTFLESIQSNEAMHEAIADSLAQGILREMNVSEREGAIKKTRDALVDPKYSYVPNARKFVERNGIQATFDLYMESPKKFMEEITKS